MKIHRLNAWVGQRLMGSLSYDDESGLFSFDYDAGWAASGSAFPFSPIFPLTGDGNSSPERHSASVRRFFENLLPEGKALDDAAAAHRLSKANLYGLLLALGRESTGAVSLLPQDQNPEQLTDAHREIGRQELSERIRDRAHHPFNIWDGRVRMPIAGHQDKLAIYIDGERLYLVEGALASTHILKPEPLNPKLPHLVANEHFCMRLAAALGLPSPRIDILRVPEPVLVVERFDRRRQNRQVERLHVIDACQALDLAVSHKYERNFGSGRDVAHIRDGVNTERLFSITGHAVAGAAMRLGLLRWMLVQYLIGNNDAHGKNVSFFVEPGGLRLAPCYDLVSVCIYAGIDKELAIAIGDEFNIADVRAYDWAQFSNHAGLERRLVAREMKRMTNALRKALPELQKWPAYGDEERMCIAEIAGFALSQAEHLDADAGQLAAVRID